MQLLLPVTFPSTYVWFGAGLLDIFNYKSGHGPIHLTAQIHLQQLKVFVPNIIFKATVNLL